MRILEARHRDVYFIVDLSLSEIIKLKAALDTATFTFDGETDILAKQGSDYIQNELYPFLSEIIESSPPGMGEV